MQPSVVIRHTLIALCLLYTPAWAGAHTTGDTFFDRVKLGIEGSLGVPLISMERGMRVLRPDSNLSLGLTAGYSFSLSYNIKIGPEIGIFYGFRRTIAMPPLPPIVQSWGAGIVCTTHPLSSARLQEQYLYIPMAMKAYFISDALFQRAIGCSLGYELAIALGTQYIHGGESERALPAAGRLFVAGTLDIMRGCYMGMRFNLPLQYRLSCSEMLQDGLAKLRELSNSSLEFSLGINVMTFLSSLHRPSISHSSEAASTVS